MGALVITACVVGAILGLVSAYAASREMHYADCAEDLHTSDVESYCRRLKLDDRRRYWGRIYDRTSPVASILLILLLFWPT